MKLIATLLCSLGLLKASTNGLEQRFAQAHQASKIPGALLLITNGTETQHILVRGQRRRHHPSPLSKSDQIHIGSCTKAMTATLLALLVEQGKLRWDSTLAELLADWSPPSAWANVTLEQLLSHRSGAPANLIPTTLNSQLTYAQQREQVVKALFKQKPKFKPGSQYLYSNTGYVLAGAIAEHLTGKSWEALIQQELFAPLEMNSAGFGAPPKAWGHDKNAKAISPGPEADNLPFMGPAGTVHLTIEDWAKFVRLHLKGSRQGWTYGQTKRLSVAQFQHLHQAQGPEHYALGWGSIERSWANGLALTHSGSNTFWMAVTWLAPQKDWAVLVVLNQGGAKAEALADQLATLAIQQQLIEK